LAPPRSSEIATTASWSPWLACSFSSDGISRRQGWHHVAHRLTSKSLPLKSARVAGLPAVSVNATSGAGCGGASGINSPALNSSGPAAKAAVTANRSATATVPKEAKPKADPGANTMWGGRFAGGSAAIMRRINASIDFDKRLYAEDIAGSQAHCAMLVAQNILSPEDGKAIAGGLEQTRSEIDSGAFVFR